MTNPWLAIPLSDYESHMALPEVAQARLLAGIFEAMLREYRPASVAVIGCAGGNGFDRINPAITRRVVGVDINPDYVDALRQRHASRIARLKLITGDIQGGGVRFDPVDLIHAALLFEYVDVERTLQRLRPLIAPKGILTTVVQVAGPAMVTPGPFASLESLRPFMHEVDADTLSLRASAVGLREVARRRETSAGGKEFDVQEFRA